MASLHKWIKLIKLILSISRNDTQFLIFNKMFNFTLYLASVMNYKVVIFSIYRSKNHLDILVTKCLIIVTQI